MIPEASVYIRKTTRNAIVTGSSVLAVEKTTKHMSCLWEEPGTVADV